MFIGVSTNPRHPIGQSCPSQRPPCSPSTPHSSFPAPVTQPPHFLSPNDVALAFIRIVRKSNRTPFGFLPHRICTHTTFFPSGVGGAISALFVGCPIPAQLFRMGGVSTQRLSSKSLRGPTSGDPALQVGGPACPAENWLNLLAALGCSCQGLQPPHLTPNVLDTISWISFSPALCQRQSV